MTAAFGATESVCPVCLRRIPAFRERSGGDMVLVKTCPEHGEFRAVVWRGAPDPESWYGQKIPSFAGSREPDVRRGCPLDCGLCPDHRQGTCTAILEVTMRCDLRCSVCFADAPGPLGDDPAIGEIEAMCRVVEAAARCNVQLSGGEPTMRDDLPEIAAMAAKACGGLVQVNTNGRRLARDASFARSLADSGVSSVFLQFDAADDSVYETLRGRPLMKEKKAAIETCAAAGLGVVLVPTLVPGVNVAPGPKGHIGAILDFAIAHSPVVRGVHFQPVSRFGRFPGDDRRRVTLPEVLRLIEDETGGRMKVADFAPPGCEHSLCSFHGDYLVRGIGDVASLRPRREDGGCGCADAGAGRRAAVDYVVRNWGAAPGGTGGSDTGGFDAILELCRKGRFTVSAMAFQDCETLDLERLRGCCIHVVTRDTAPGGGRTSSGGYRLVPFCARYCTSLDGTRLYAPHSG
jgi:uncharacterized radical SAM superfamily Fe-S cluster-containing enzyme